jgi:hypothetical protein
LSLHRTATRTPTRANTSPFDQAPPNIFMEAF